MTSSANIRATENSEVELRKILESRLYKHVSKTTVPRTGPSDYDLNPDMDHHRSVKPGLIPAAVLIGIRFNPAPTVLFTQRAPNLPHHAGQISFPGGKVDAIDRNEKAAAIREANEELGIADENLEPQGFIDNYETATGFIISPLVAIIAPQTQIQPNPDEVEGAFDVPLDFLMNPQNRQKHKKQYGGKSRYFYALPYEQYYIWGATAGILVNMQERLFGT